MGCIQVNKLLVSVSYSLPFAGVQVDFSSHKTSYNSWGIDTCHDHDMILYTIAAVSC